MGFLYGTGRFLYGSFFLYSGVNHLINAEQLEGYAASKDRPNPRLEVSLSGTLMLIAGASIALGQKPRLGATGVLGFLAVATPVFHDFWNVQDSGQKQNEVIQFTKNAALFGAALMIAGTCKKKKQPKVKQ